ncbi:MAG: hypothetical protein JXR96_23050 [Deltaproteobacteria bacterium]|nr:hypothetical protein [Deltaproteobacteria bacterium]
MKTLPKILITGAPGVGKTQLLQGIADTVLGVKAAGIQAAGILSVEQQDKKGRSNYVLKTLDGREEVFAITGKGRGNRVGKYQVDVEAFESLALDAIGFHAGTDLYVIDEIGPMQTLSRIFSETAKMLLKKDEVAVVASVSRQGRGFIREVKRMAGVDTLELNEDNFRELLEQISKELLRAFAERSKASPSP